MKPFGRFFTTSRRTQDTTKRAGSSTERLMSRLAQRYWRQFAPMTPYGFMIII
jgi:hypothetical protein